MTEVKKTSSGLSKWAIKEMGFQKNDSQEQSALDLDGYVLYSLPIDII